MFGPLDDLFDFNHDGKLDAGELAFEMDYLEKEQRMMEGASDDDVDDIDAETLELADIDPDELEFMDEDEIREAFDDAGLDADDFDF